MHAACFSYLAPSLLPSLGSTSAAGSTDIPTCTHTHTHAHTDTHAIGIYLNASTNRTHAHGPTVTLVITRNAEASLRLCAHLRLTCAARGCGLTHTCMQACKVCLTCAAPGPGGTAPLSGCGHCSGMTSDGCPACTQPLYTHSLPPVRTYTPRANDGSKPAQVHVNGAALPCCDSVLAENHMRA